MRILVTGPVASSRSMLAIDVINYMTEHHYEIDGITGVKQMLYKPSLEVGEDNPASTFQDMSFNDLYVNDIDKLTLLIPPSVFGPGEFKLIHKITFTKTIQVEGEDTLYTKDQIFEYDITVPQLPEPVDLNRSVINEIIDSVLIGVFGNKIATFDGYKTIDLPRHTIKFKYDPDRDCRSNIEITSKTP